MSNVFDDMRYALSEAKDTLKAADSCATDMAFMLEGRLRNVNNVYTLQALKRELASFNMRTKEWK